MGILDAMGDGAFFIIKIISELVLVVASLPIVIFIKRIANQKLGATKFILRILIVIGDLLFLAMVILALFYDSN